MAFLADLLVAVGLAAGLGGLGVYFGLLILRVVGAISHRLSPRNLITILVIGTYARYVGMLGLFILLLGSSMRSGFSWITLVIVLVFGFPYALLLIERPLTPDNPLGFDPKRVPWLRGPARKPPLDPGDRPPRGRS
jgi:hypothetical protein